MAPLSKMALLLAATAGALSSPLKSRTANSSAIPSYALDFGTLLAHSGSHYL